MKNKTIKQSFKTAWQGVRKTAARERNFRVHIFMGMAAVAFCIVFRVDGAQFVWVCVSIFFVLCMELINTSVEALTDLICGNNRHPLAKIAKDAAAAAVLLASLMAVVVGLMVITTVVRRYIS